MEPHDGVGGAWVFGRPRAARKLPWFAAARPGAVALAAAAGGLAKLDAAGIEANNTALVRRSASCSSG